MPESTTLVRRDVISLVALNLVLGVVFRSVMRMALVIKIAGMNLDNPPRHPPRFRIPAHVLADSESQGHLTESSILLFNASLQQNRADTFSQTRDGKPLILGNVTEAQLARTAYLKGVDKITLGKLLEPWVEHDRGHLQE